MSSNLLLKVGKTIGLDVGYFLKNGLWVFFRYLILNAIGIIISSVFAHLAPREVFGQYQFVIAFLSFFSILSLPGLNTLSLRETVNRNEYALIQSFRYSFLGCLIVSAVCLIYGFYVIFFTSPVLGWSLVVAGILAPFFYAPNNWYALYEGRLNFTSSTVRIIITQVGLLAAMLYALYVHVSLPWLIFFYLLSPVLFNVLFYIEASRTIKDKFQKRLDMRFAVLASLQKFFLSFGENIQVFLVTFFYGFERLALYQIAYLVVGAISGLVGALASLYFPLLVKYEKIHYGRTVIHHLLIGFVASLGYLAFLKLLFLWLYGEAYRDSLVLAYGFAGIVFLLPLRLFLITFLTAKDKNNVIIIVSVLTNVVSLVVFYFIQELPFNISVSVYLYSLHILFILPLLAYFFSIARKNYSLKELKYE